MTWIEARGGRVRVIRWCSAPPVKGCRWCGMEEENHGLRHQVGHGVHEWAVPTPAQVAARMLARGNLA